MMLRLAASRAAARPALMQHAVRGLASKATGGSYRPVHEQDPDPNTPVMKALDRLADAAFMTELFRGVRAVHRLFNN